YYFLCSGGVRSASVAAFLTDHGIASVNVEGGMRAWGEGGLEFKRI
ncbi:rhodanese-like domain-containing protein, partial [Staphylococcus pseudintermedius]